jgi:hypothetical protein
MQTEPGDLAYLAKKIIWRSWIHSLSWLRRHRVLST